MIYSINYDLNIPGQNYDRVRHAIEALGPSYKALKSTFLVRTSKSANEVWGSIHSAFDATDRCLVSEVTANHSGWLGKDVGNGSISRALQCGHEVTQLGSARSPAKAADRFLKIRTTNDDDRIRLGTRFDADAIRHMGGTMSEQLPPAKDRIDVVETQARRRLSIEKT